MRDDSQRWAPPRDRKSDITAPGLTIKTLSVERLILLSGPRALQQTELPLIDWPTVGQGPAYALTLRRDRVLEVNGPARAEGWNTEAGLAISDATDAFTQIELSGANALPLLNRGTDLDINTPSRSVARMLFGLGVFVYRHSGSNSFRIHVASGHDEALWHALQDAAKHLS